ncbi:MAG: ABC transporter permease [Candidatus Eisenbacteria bacterium]|nr:ABC transporter permease [Candidatus Eisenbacteria bacterium]
MSTRELAAPFVGLANTILDAIAGVGRFSRFLGLLLAQTIPGLRYWHLFMDQCRAIGIGSIPLVALTSLFVGAVAALQAAYQFKNNVPLLWLGSVVAKSVIIEVGPVLTALVVGGRVGSSIAAELGTMKVTEQIDALETLALSPIRYLAVPRVLAATLMVPVITVFADALAILGGLLVAVFRIGMTPHLYFKGMRLFFEVEDIYGGLIKSFVFGTIIAIMGCYYGFQTEGGAEGVGVATTRAVVASCVMILVSDYFLAEVIFQVIFK